MQLALLLTQLAASCSFAWSERFSNSEIPCIRHFPSCQLSRVMLFRLLIWMRIDV